MTGFKDALQAPEAAMNSIEDRIKSIAILTETGIDHFPVVEIVELQ